MSSTPSTRGPTNARGKKKARPQSRSASSRRKNPTRRRAALGERRRRWLLAAVVALGCVGTAALLLWLWGSEPASTVAFDGTELRVVTIDSPEAHHVAQKLQDEGLISDLAAFTWYQRIFLPNARFELGEHLVPAQSSPRELVRLLARHRSRAVQKVLIPEGYDLFQVAERLEGEGICTARSFKNAALEASRALSELGASSFEGYLYPAVYELRLNSEPGAVLRKMVDEARARFAATFAAHRSDFERLRHEFGFREHDVLILASVVQKETANEGEAGKVASVFLNRLSDPEFKPLQALQSDPTAGYGCKLPDAPDSCRGFNGAIRPSLLRDAANRYNTYRHRGLPPGPISNPSSEMIEAVLRAPQTDYLYFVLGEGGQHVFSQSFAAHRAAIKRRASVIEGGNASD